MKLLANRPPRELIGGGVMAKEGSRLETRLIQCRRQSGHHNTLSIYAVDVSFNRFLCIV